MGVFKMFSSSSADKISFSSGTAGMRSASRYLDVNGKVKSDNKSSLPNPDPKNYEIQSHCQNGEYLVVRVKYLDCTNYEGVKILVFKSTLEKLIKQNNKMIDPHFCENKKFISPIARFAPTTEGWSDAIAYATRKHKEKK